MLEIQTNDNNPILRVICKKVDNFDIPLIKNIKEMAETMLAPDPETKVKGIGIAANQVGIDARIILITLNINTKKDHKILPLINPEIIEVSEKKVVMEEGCLSVPGKFAKISRPGKVKARWQNMQGKWCEKKFEKWDARIFLHEYDHLEGILFTDYLKKKS